MHYIWHLLDAIDHWVLGHRWYGFCCWVANKAPITGCCWYTRYWDKKWGPYFE